MMNSWSQVIIEWANCLGVVESSVESIQDLQDGVFYETLVSQLCRGIEDCSFNDLAIESDEHFVSKFLRAEYPLFEDAATEEIGSKDLYTASLLLIQCAQQPMFHRPMCVALKQETQVRIKRFLELVLPCGKNLTREFIDSAMKEVRLDASPGQARATPRGRPLREFFNSPAVKSARSQRFMNERNRELMCLRAQLETEQYEKADLVEDLKIQSEKVCNLQKKLEEKAKELRDLRIDRLKPPTPQSCRKSNKSTNGNEERYRRQAQELEISNSQLMAELEKVRGEREELARRLSSSEKSTETITDRLSQSQKTVESLTHELETRNNEIGYLRINAEELREHIRQTKRLSFGEQSFDVEPTCDEALSSIVDLQLQEARMETSQLRNELAEVRLKLENSLRECQRLPELEILFREKTTELDSLRESLEHTEKQLSVSNTQVAALERERSQLSEKVTNLQGSLNEKIQLLALNESDLQMARSKIHDLADSLETAESETIELNSIVQSARRELDKTQSLVASQEEKLLLLTKERNDFERLLSETRDELRGISTSLETEKVSVKNLESLVKSSNEQSEALRRDLTLSNERLMLVNGERKILEATLRSTVEKLETSESCLQKERTRSAELETILSKVNQDTEALRISLESREESFNNERRKVTELESIVERRKEERKDLEATLDGLKATLQTERDETNALREIVSRSKKRCEDLESLLESKGTLLEHSKERESCLNEELESCRVKINELSDSLRTEVAKSCHLETQLSQNNDKYIELEAKLISSETLLEEREAGKRQIEMELRTANDTIKEIETKLVEAKSERSSLEEQQRRSISANDALQEYTKVAAEKILHMESKIFNCEALIEKLDRSSTEKTEKVNELQNELNEKSTCLDSLKLLLEESEERNAVTANELRTTERRIAELMELRQEMESQIAQERERSSNLCDEIERLQEKLSVSVDKNNDFEAKFDKLTKEFNQSREKLHKEMAVSEELNKTLHELRTKNNELEENLTTKQNQITSLRSQWEESKEELASRVNEISGIQQNMDGMMQELEASQDNLQKESLKNEQVSKELDSLRAINRELEEKLASTKNEIETVLNEWDECKKELASYVSKVSTMELDIAKMADELKESQENYRKQSQETEGVRKDLDASRAINRELEEKLASKKNEIVTVLNEWDECKTELASYVSKVSAMELDIAKMADELKESQENYRKQSQETEGVRKDLDASRAINRELEEKLASKKNEIETVLNEWDECKTELASYVSKVSAMELDIEKMTDELKESQENYRKQSQETEGVRKDLDASRAINQELEEKLASKKNEIETVLNEWDECKKELASYVSKLSTMELDIAKMADELKESQENYRKQSQETEGVRKDLDASRAINRELEEKLASKKNEIETVLNEWDECKKELASYVSKVSTMELDIAKMADELKESQENYRKQSQETEGVRKDLDASRAINQELEEKLALKKNEIETVQNEWDECKTELATYVSKVSSMELDIEKLTDELKESQENYRKQSQETEGVRKDLDASRATTRELEELSTNRKIEVETLTTERNNLKEELARSANEKLTIKMEIEKMKDELEQYASDMEKQMVANAMLSEKELESNKSIERLQLQLAEEHERLKNLESEKTLMEEELSSCALLKIETAEEIKVLQKVVERSRADQQSLQEKHNEERAEFNQRIEQLKEKSKLHLEEINSLRNELENIKLEREGLTEKIQDTSNSVTVLEKRLLVAENLRMEVELEDKLKKEALKVVQTKLERLGKEKIESELRMKEVIANLQQVRTSQDQVMEAQIQALEEKSRQHENLEKELESLRVLFEEKSKRLGSEESRVKEVLAELQKLEENIEEKSALVEKLESSVESERRRVSETEQSLESLREKMREFGRATQNLKLELNCLWDSVRETCPELARSKHIAEEDATRLLEAFVEDTKAVRKVVSILSEANETLKEHASSEKESAKIMCEEVKKDKLELEERLKCVEAELENRHRQVSMLGKRSQEVREFVQKVASEKEKVKDELVHLINRWSLLNVEADEFVSSAILDCDELKYLVSQRNAIETALINLNEGQVSSSRSLLQALDRIFSSTETDQVEDNFLPEAILSEEVLQRDDELMKRDLASLGKKMNEFSESLKTYDTKLRSGLLKDAAESEKKLRAELERITKEKKEIREKLDTARARSAKMEKNMDELRNESKKVKSELTEELEKLRALIEKLEEEKTELSKRINEKADVETLHKEYGQKLEKIKQKMKTAYNEQIAKLNQEQEKILKGKMESLKIQTEQQCRKYAEDIAKYKAHISDLSSRYWDVGEKLLSESQEKQVALQQVQKLKELRQHQDANVEIREQVLQTRQKTASLDRREFTIDRLAREPAARTGYGAVEVIEEETTTFSTHRRHSVKSIQAMGNAFRAEDEEGEVFDSVYLADLKEGRCAPTGPDLDRLSELRMRNSMCRPHLKSSYAVETHLQPIALHEDDIKNGVTGDDVFNDSLSQSLLPGQKPKKKDRTQTSYKRPGPPTPSKNGGRLSLQGNELKSPNSRILKERNVERRTTATPRGLKNLFGTSMSKRQDENTLGTPKGRRLSNIFRKQRTERN